MSQSEQVSTVSKSRDTKSNLIWLRYHMLIYFFGILKTYGQHIGTLRTHSRLVDLEPWLEHVTGIYRSCAECQKVTGRKLSIGTSPPVYG